MTNTGGWREIAANGEKRTAHSFARPWTRVPTELIRSETNGNHLHGNTKFKTQTEKAVARRAVRGMAMLPPKEQASVDRQSALL